MNKIQIVLRACLLAGHVCAQNSSLPEVQVSADRIHLHSVGIAEYSVDSVLWKNRSWADLTDILRHSMPAVVRQYGPGMITTFRVRGLPSEHFKVVWNGLSLNNVALGLFDLSGSAGFSFDRMAIFQGNMAGFYGSGSGSGALVLSSEPVSDVFQADIVSSLGSFGYRNTGVLIGGRVHRVNIKGRISQQLARNDFEFTNLSLQRQRLLHGSYLHTNANVDINYSLSDNKVLHLGLWRQSSFINIPPSRVESRFNTSRQWNDNLRSVLTYTRKGTKSNYSMGAGWISEQIVYQNDILRSSDTSRVSGVQSFARGQIFGRRWKVQYNTEFSHHKAPSAQRADEAEQTLAVANASYEQWINPRMRLAGTLRQERMDDRWATPVLLVAGEMYAKGLTFNLSAGNYFRWPTLNERFWLPGGNPDLLPESGFTADAGVNASYKKGSLIGVLKIRPFIQWINQLILWQPTGSVWSPVNIQHAMSRGVEVRTEVMHYYADNQSLIFQLNYCFNRTEVIRADGGQQVTVGKQLIYSPLHVLSSVAHYTFKEWQLLTTAQVQSGQHTLSDNHPSGVMSGFFVANAQVNRNFTLKNTTVIAGVEIQNIFNIEYQMIAQRPMPGRSFRLNLLIQFTNPKSINL